MATEWPHAALCRRPAYIRLRAAEPGCRWRWGTAGSVGGATAMPASCPSDCARERGADGVGVEPLRGVLNANCATAPSLRVKALLLGACRLAAGQRRRCKGAGRRALSSPAVQRAAHGTRFPRSTERPDRGFWASARRCVARRDAEPGTWLPDLLQLWCAVSNASRPPASPASPRAAPLTPVILSRTPTFV